MRKRAHTRTHARARVRLRGTALGGRVRDGSPPDRPQEVSHLGQRLLHWIAAADAVLIPVAEAAGEQYPLSDRTVSSRALGQNSLAKQRVSALLMHVKDPEVCFHALCALPASFQRMESKKDDANKESNRAAAAPHNRFACGLVVLRDGMKHQLYGARYL